MRGSGGGGISSSSRRAAAGESYSRYSRDSHYRREADEDKYTSPSSSSSSTSADPLDKKFLKPTKEQLLAEEHEKRSSSSSSSSASSGGIDPSLKKDVDRLERDDSTSSSSGTGGAGGGGEGGLLDDDLFSGDVKAVSMIEKDELEVPLRKLNWFAALLPQTRGELLTELGGSYLFLLHGDSLILHLLRKTKYVDFAVEQGLQPLVYVHLIERQLSALQSAGAHFHLVFFNLFQYVQTSGTLEASSDSIPLAYSLIREQLLLHLAASTSSSSKEGNAMRSDEKEEKKKDGEDLRSSPHDEDSGKKKVRTSSVTYTILDDWFADDWTNLIKCMHPTFLLIDDIHFDRKEEEEEEYLHSINDEEDEEEEEEEEEESQFDQIWRDSLNVTQTGSLPREVELLHEEAKKKMKKRGRAWVSSLLQSLILSSCSLNLHVALMQGAMYKKTKVFCLAISPTSGVALWNQLEKKRLDEEEERKRKNIQDRKDDGEGESVRKDERSDDKEERKQNEEKDKEKEETPRQMIRRSLHLYEQLLLPLEVLKKKKKDGEEKEEKEAEEEEEEEEKKDRENLVQLMRNLSAAVGGGKNASSSSPALLRYLLAHRFCYFLKTVAEEEEEGEEEEEEESEGRQQLNQFIAIGKMLIMAAMCMEELSLQERCHYTVDSARAPFISEYLYAPLTLYYKEAIKTLRQLRCMYTSSSSHWEAFFPGDLGQSIYGDSGGVAICDFFDSKFFFTLMAYACHYARTSNDWVLDASYFGLTPSAQGFLNLSWEGLFTPSSSSSLPPSFLNPFFPIDLSPLSSVLEMYCLPLPTVSRSVSSSALEGETHAHAVSSSSSSHAPELLPLHSRFLMRFRAGNLEGRLPAVDVLSWDEAQERRKERAETKIKQIAANLLLSQERGEDEGQEGVREEELLDKLRREEEEKENILENVERKAQEDFETQPSGRCLDFAELEVMHVNTRRFEPNEWQRAKMDQMNGEQKKRYLDIIERKSKQRLLTQLRRKARSLCPHPLHYPIVSTSDSSHPWLSLSSSAPIGEDNGQDASSSSPSSLANSRHEASKGKGAKGREKKSQTSNKKEEEKKKPLKKADLIRMKNTGIQEKKVQNLDAERLADLEKRLEALCSEYCSLSSKSSLLSSFTHNGVPFCIGASHLHSLLLDVLVGPSRRMSLLFNFPYVTQLLKTRDAQRSFVMKVQKLINEAYAGFNKESLNSKSHFQEMCKLLSSIFRVNTEAYRLFKGELEGQDIEDIQRSLISLGFPDVAEKIFKEWKKKRILFLKQKEEDELLAKSQAEVLSSTGAGGKHHKAGGAAAQKKDKKAAKNEKGKKKDATKEGKENDEKKEGCLGEEEESEESKALNIHRVSRAAVYDFRVKNGSEAHVQLRFMGGDFERTTGSRAKKDPRVLFTPDYWQVHLLDLIDRYESAFVTAPTSSGKTFICFYAMELVLRLSNCATIVYVSPSKALADQVYAEVYGRFSSKGYPSGCKKVLSGEYLWERCTDKPLDAQVLITIPSILEMLLMSGGVKEWTSNLKYVILDEIHCISEEEAGGSKWERLIQMLPCPFLAMSATVGNPDSFLHWIRQANPKYPITHVDYRERFSDLHMLLYHQEHLLPLNPVCSVHYNKVKVEGLASDFYVPPADGLNVYLVLRKILGEEHSFSRQFLPSFYFAGCTAITKKQYRYYWNTLRHAFVYQVQRGELNSSLFSSLQRGLQENLQISWCRDVSLFEAIQSYMSPALKKAGFSMRSLEDKKDGEEEEDYHDQSSSSPPSSLSRIEEGEKSEEEEEEGGKKKKKERTDNYLETVMEQTEFSKSYLDPDNLIGLCRQLDSAQLLPCLIFNFFRHEIRKMGVGMARRLKQLQMDKYYGTEEAAYQTRLANKKRAEQYQAALAQRELEAKLRGLSWQQREAQGIGKDDAGAGGLEDEGIPPPPIDIAEEVDEEFSFASMKAMGMNFDDVKSAIEEVKSKASSATDHDLVEGLRRGVGIYDAGLSRTYREAVDFLFRIGYLRVCICSNALALGMNMPCKTSVFAGDAFVLTPTMFKQSGGRAGRRGYDAVGSILFWEVPFNKINRLLEARLPVFSGDFPVTPMLTLRSMRLYEQLENQEDRRKEEEAQVSLQRLFLQPLFCVSADNAKPVPQSLDRLRFYTRFHFRFLCDFLQRLGLLHDGSEETGSGCGLTAWGHMAELSYERETASFFLHFMIYSGIFSEYLREAMSQRGGSVDALSFLMHVLAVCICQEPVTSGQCLRFKLKHDRVMQRVHLNGDSMKTTNEEEKDYEEGSRRGKVLVAAKASEQRALNLPSFRPFLPLLPDDVEAASQAYNDLAFSTSVRCLRGACSVLAEREGEEASFLPEEFCLPYTHVDFSPSRRLSHPRRKQEEKTEKKEEEEEKEKYMRRGASDFFILYERLIKRNVIKSPFCAVTGRTEDTNDFSCVEEIQDTVRSIFPFYPETMCAEVQCNYTWIRHWNEKKKKEVKVKVRGFNSYLLDFLTYKSFRFLTQNNEIGAGRVWYLVADLVRTLELLAKRSPPACVNDNKNNEEEEYRKKNMLPPTPSLHSVLLDLYEEVAKIFKKESA